MQENELLEVKKIVKKYMFENNLSPKKMGEKFKLSEGTIKTYMYGRKKVSYEFLIHFSKFKNLNVDDVNFIKKIVSGHKQKLFIKNKEEFCSEELLNSEISKKIKELEKLENEIRMKKIEYNTLERTSGVRSKIAWASIDIQKHTASKIIEIMSIFNIANYKNKKESIPALRQLSIHLENFSQQIKRVIKEIEMEEIDYE